MLRSISGTRFGGRTRRSRCAGEVVLVVPDRRSSRPLNRSTALGRGCHSAPMINDLEQRLNRPRFPRSAGYDPQWLVDNWMGPSALWLMEWLCSGLDLAPGARVLDL